MVVAIDTSKNYSMTMSGGPGNGGPGDVTVPGDVAITGNATVSATATSTTGGAVGEFTKFSEFPSFNYIKYVVLKKDD